MYNRAINIIEKKEIKQSVSLLKNNEPTSFSLEIKHKQGK